MQHVQLTHEDTGDTCEERSALPECSLCQLFFCKLCGGVEGSLATECPGVRITEQQQDDIYAGKLDFVGGEWREKK
jgi:hypothetical protein